MCIRDRDRGLEWLYRLYKEPWRWRRMLALPKFAMRVLLSRELELRAARGSREQLLAILAKAPDVEPEEYDRLDD